MLYRYDREKIEKLITETRYERDISTIYRSFYRVSNSEDDECEQPTCIVTTSHHHMTGLPQRYMY